ncbi:dihydropteroate synthase [Allopseudospirillum japonicum]|uniref:Dihydropteroate synthase n=1 Tax=Allopseudospirillum japonicum TaxID=64971 RepID=A0A1H6R0U4_9GAMM|nr:dihydropteroate synthase [Allopseudospirillum japonicum]
MLAECLPNLSAHFAQAPVLTGAGKSLVLDRPRVMGILNVTPDSFSDGGCYQHQDQALRHAQAMLAAGADLIDVGGESTRPGAAPVSTQEEVDRVVPIVEALVQKLDAKVSVDTSTPEVIQASAQAGAFLINDVRALQRPGALEAAAATGLPVCLMHMQGEPQTMQAAPQYQNIVQEVSAFLQARVQAAQAAGIPAHQLILDPGFGFGKTCQHNLYLLRQMTQLHALGYPLLVGMSRKSMIGQVLDRPVEQRLAGSLSLALIAGLQGSHILRVHDVAATVDVLKMAWATLAASTDK